MAKHIVLEIVDREIGYLVYDTIEDAIQALRDSYEEIRSEYNVDEDDCFIDETETSAWINNDLNVCGGDNYDWEIISIV